MSDSTAGILMLAIIIGSLTIGEIADAWKERGIAKAKAEVEIEAIKAKAAASSEDDAR